VSDEYQRHLARQFANLEAAPPAPIWTGVDRGGQDMEARATYRRDADGTLHVLSMETREPAPAQRPWKDIYK
tara:strand:- start:21437 stop:21652 length:216 start_codon:yes stop_codon:yes gene_type:complete